MKKNKLIYLSVFALTFFMFLSNVNADGCCIKENGTYTYYDYEQKANNAFNRYATQIIEMNMETSCNILKDTGNYQDVIYVNDEATPLFNNDTLEEAVKATLSREEGEKAGEYAIKADSIESKRVFKGKKVKR